MSLPRLHQGEEPLNDYEQERADRIARNQRVMDEMGIVRQATLLDAGLRARKASQTPRFERKPKQPTSPSKRRTSTRLANLPPQNKGLTGDERELHGRLMLEEKDAAHSSAHEERWAEFVSQHRCDSQSRGSIYDSHAGICCHFCRQKKLCGEPECQRCIQRNPDIACIGKSECTRCGSATGRFCRACLLVRYGMPLETVREQMAAGAWLCPHCYEEDHPNEGWICNSSICMTRRGMKPTGIAIYEAQQKGFASVGHFVQAQILARMGKQAPASTAAPQAEEPMPASEASETAGVKEHANEAAAAAEASAGSVFAPITPARTGAAACDKSDEAAAAGPERAGKENAQGQSAAAAAKVTTAAPSTPAKRPLQPRMAVSEGRVTRGGVHAGRKSLTPQPQRAPHAAGGASVRVTRGAARRLLA